MSRRLMKALEDLSIQYDETVRNANGSIVQFLYGDDGMDPARMEGKDGFPLNFNRLFLKVKATCPAGENASLSALQIEETVKRLKEHNTSAEGCSDAFKTNLSGFLEECKEKFKNTREALGLHGEHVGEENLDIQEKFAKNISGITSKQLQHVNTDHSHLQVKLAGSIRIQERQAILQDKKKEILQARYQSITENLRVVSVMASQRGSCWFGVESKSFEILMEQVKGRWLDSLEIPSSWVEMKVVGATSWVFVATREGDSYCALCCLWSKKFKKAQSSKEHARLLVDGSGREAPQGGFLAIDEEMRERQMLFSEKSASEMENYEAREEEENSLEIDAYLSFLVYLGRAKLKNIPRGRVVRPMFAEPPFPFSSRVVSIVFGFRFSILLNILVVSMGKGKALKGGDEGEDLSPTSGKVESEEEKRIDEGLQASFDEPTLPTHLTMETAFAGHGGCSVLGTVGKILGEKESIEEICVDPITKEWFRSLEERSLGTKDALLAKAARFEGKRDVSLGGELLPPSSLVAKARWLDDGFRILNQLVGKGCGWD
ncbi:DNA-directed RNA polymerase III subunit 1 [Vitis vinifera]|uniref:DNA-directed RNA polymerase n=1 Tax=Vitis vinifera TaxID=29760 RepID=A0A438KNM3_VITVI|nr:DNA-directed RNA polymerase III subunit 1 [Vitis vinifera]